MSKPQARILVVDDEPQITKVLRTSLTSQGFEVESANDGVAAMDVFHSWKPQLVISDVSMPRMDGVELCRLIRAESSIPIIVLSVIQEEQKKVEALDAGADDYITKPFGIDELMARVRVGLRHLGRTSETTSRIEAGQFKIDLDTREVMVGEKQVYLTPREFDLLVFLIRNSGKVVTHRAILSNVWGTGYQEHSDSLRVFVGQLRKKIEVDPSQPRFLTTEPWVGYRFNPE
jgi:two-component system, OmpR family, KDP operon response regulator KdpE